MELVGKDAVIFCTSSQMLFGTGSVAHEFRLFCFKKRPRDGEMMRPALKSWNALPEIKPQHMQIVQLSEQLSAFAQQDYVL